MPDNSLSHIKEYSEEPLGGRTDINRFMEKVFHNPTQKYATFSFPIDAIDPLAYLEMCWDDSTFQFYWEKPDDELAITAGEELVTISADGADRFNSINKEFKELQKSTGEYAVLSHPYAGMLMLGGFSFSDQISGKLWNTFKPASFTLPRWMIVKNGKFTIATFAIELDNYESPDELHEYLENKLKQITTTITLRTNGNQPHSEAIRTDTVLPKNGSGFEQWKSSINKAKTLIQQQNFDKIVLARNVAIPRNTDITPTQVLNRLRQQYTRCHNFLINQPSGKTFVGSTPERLGSFRNRLLLTEALAGSIQRGETATEDTILEKNLSDSSKNREEHNFVIRDIEDRLHPLVESMERNTTPEIKKLNNVQHLYTPIRAKLKDNTDPLEVIGQLHPTPAVGGYPWKDAAPYINELEDFDRGWYAGPIGWLNTKGGGEFAVAIRSGLFTESEVHFFAGCGIVEDSDPAAEWEETNLKLKPMLSALQYD